MCSNVLSEVVQGERRAGVKLLKGRLRHATLGLGWARQASHPLPLSRLPLLNHSHEIQTLDVLDMPILQAYVGCQCTNVVWPDLG